MTANEFPDLPATIRGAMGDREWAVPLPPEAAQHIGQAQYVYRNPDTGALVSPIVERVAAEWDLVRRKSVTGLSRHDIPRLIGTLFQLVPGDPVGVWRISEGREPAWAEKPEQTELNRSAAAYILGAVLARSWKPRGSERPGLAAYAERQELSVPDSKADLCAAGFLLASEEEGHKQAVRLGGEYLTDVQGGREPRPIDDIPARDYLRWLFARAIRHARNQVRKTRGPALSLEEAGSLEAAGPGTLDALAAVMDSRTEVDTLKDLASPQQRRILDAMEAAISAGATVEEARQRAAQSEGITPSSLRTQLERLRKKAEAM